VDQDAKAVARKEPTVNPEKPEIYLISANFSEKETDFKKAKREKKKA
jgi:hypothetical protein